MLRYLSNPSYINSALLVILKIIAQSFSPSGCNAVLSTIGSKEERS